MSDVRAEGSFLTNAWRFAHVLTGCPEGASKVFKDSLEELLRHPNADETDRARPLLLSIVRKRSLKFPARCELPPALAPLYSLLEPDRSALVLLSLDALPPENLPQLLGVDPRFIADLAKQADAAVAKEIRSLPLSDAARSQIEEAAETMARKHEGPHLSVRNPASLAVAFGFLLLVAVLVWHFLGQAGVFPEEAVKIATLGAKAGPDQFEPVEEKAGGLQDWFMLKGYDTFRVPPGFENFSVVGVRKFKVENEAVAQAAVLENTMYFYSFAAGPFGITISPEKSWRITEADRTVLAIREEGGICFLVAFRGTKKDMQHVLKEAGASH